MINNSRLSIAIVLFLFVVSVSCSISKRVNEDKALQTIKKIRSAQKAFKAENGRYGSLNELESTNLIESELEDGTDSGYRFILVTDNSTYSVSAVPLNKSGQKMADICIFLDETEVIRASYNASVPATKFSESIVNQ